MDPFEELLEDLGGDKIKVLSHAPVFIGPYSRLYRGQVRENGELVWLFVVFFTERRTNAFQVAVKVLNAVDGAALPTMQRASLVHLLSV